MKLIRLACAAGVILVSGGCAESLTAPPAPVPTTVTPGPGPNQFVIRGPAHQEGGVPLIVVDGRVLRDNHEAQQITPDQIERLDVLKGRAAVDRFGASGANGVILITTRR
jgi:TonB-dependent SusC/RagA subfamily outer membrane receptor